MNKPRAGLMRILGKPRSFCNFFHFANFGIFFSFETGFNPWTPEFVSHQLSNGRKLEFSPNCHTLEENLPVMKAGRTVCLGMFFLKLFT